MSGTCWCGQTIPHPDPFTDLGHQIMTALRIPELAAFLARRWPQ